MAAKTLLQLAHEAEVRFWPKVDKRGPDDCWPWLASTNSAGYGKLFVGYRNGRQWLAPATHLAWIYTFGNEPEGGLHLCHHCDNPACVNPRHLFTGTPAENLADMKRKGRSARGERCGTARLTARQVVAVREKYAAGSTQRALARSFGVHQPTIGKIVRGERWGHVGGPRTHGSAEGRRVANRQPKLAAWQVVELRQLAVEGMSSRELGERFGVSSSNACAIASGKSRRRDGGPILGLTERLERKRGGRRRKIDAQAAMMIRARHAHGESQRSIAVDYAISVSQVCNIVNRKAWAWLPEEQS